MPVRHVLLQLGSTGREVVSLQRRLNDLGAELIVDGLFGPRTEEAVASFQAGVGLYSDGVVGPRTNEALAWSSVEASTSGRLDIVRVPADKHRDGYGSLRLRADVAAAYRKVSDTVHRAGGIMTSSGGLRGLSAKVSANRSATSLHYLGRAFDLFVYSAKVDPHTDPYVVVPDPAKARAWIVYVRVSDGEPMTLDAMTWERTLMRTSGVFLNLTELLSSHGFERIRARPSFWPPRSINGASEWWHFQWEKGLVEGETSFGTELLKVYPLATLEGSAPWRHRNLRWHAGWS